MSGVMWEILLLIHYSLKNDESILYKMNLRVKNNKDYMSIIQD